MHSSNIWAKPISSQKMQLDLIDGSVVLNSNKLHEMRLKRRDGGDLMVDRHGMVFSSISVSKKMDRENEDQTSDESYEDRDTITARMQDETVSYTNTISRQGTNMR